MVTINILNLLRVSEANEVPISSHIWVDPSTFIGSKIFLKNWKKFKSSSITYLGLAESF